MKKNDLLKYHQENIKVITQKVEDLQTQLLDIRMQKQLGQIKNVHQETSIKKDIAQLKTIIRIKELTQHNNNQTKIS